MVVGNKAFVHLYRCYIYIEREREGEREKDRYYIYPSIYLSLGLRRCGKEQHEAANGTFFFYFVEGKNRRGLGRCGKKQHKALQMQFFLEKKNRCGLGGCGKKQYKATNALSVHGDARALVEGIFFLKKKTPTQLVCTAMHVLSGKVFPFFKKNTLTHLVCTAMHVLSWRAPHSQKPFK